MRKEMQVEKQVVRVVTEYGPLSCDLCGVTDRDPDYAIIFDVIVEVGSEGCAPTKITRDVCDYCYQERIAPLLDPFFLVVKAGDEELSEAHEDRWYG